MTRMVATVAELDALSGDWQRLLEMTPLGSGFHTHGWIRACWTQLSRPGDEMFVLVAERDSRIVGILPLRRRHGGVAFIGAEVSNYSGPVLEPACADDVTAEWLAALASDWSVRSVDFANLREGDSLLRAVRAWAPARGAPPRIVLTGECPEVDLSCGWDEVYRRHGSGRRSSWRTKWRRLGALGDVAYTETDDPETIERALPDAFRLWDRRWAGRWASAAFTHNYRPFHLAATASGAETLSSITIDGQMIAFCLGLRADGVTTGYVMAHDDRLNPYSPGLLLLLQILEAAGRRGDAAYDFSLGEMGYKSLWATGSRPVFRAVWGTGARLAAARQQLWVAARSHDRLRDLKVEGPYRVRRLVSGSRTEPNAPGVPLPAGDVWRVFRGRDGDPAQALTDSEVGFSEMRRRLSPRMLREGFDRTFHGDRLSVLSVGGSEMGVAWRAGERWKANLAKVLPGTEDAAVCWYDPRPCEGASLDELVSGLLSAPGTIVALRQPLRDAHAEPLGTVRLDGKDARAAE